MAQDPDFDRIAAKAHQLWEAEGHPHGRDQEHWDKARELVAIEDSYGDTLLPRDTGVDEPIEEPEVALRNLADMPNLTDQGENLLTSTDREPELVATPSANQGRMPKVEVPISDQPGITPKGRGGKAVGKSDARSDKSTETASTVAASPKTASVSKPAKPEVVKTKIQGSRQGGRKGGA